jgi:6-pyruvoyl-tetrahydropterin synthase
LQITVSRTISMGHRLPSYDGICASPHGHNVKVELTIHPHRKFLDFKYVDKVLQSVLEPLDHAMVLQADDVLYEFCVQNSWRCLALPFEPTTEALAQWLFRVAHAALLPEGEVLELTVHETDKYSATCKGVNI